MSRREILYALGLSDRKSLRQRHLSPALQNGYVEMDPSRRTQRKEIRYRLTGLGADSNRPDTEWTDPRAVGVYRGGSGAVGDVAPRPRSSASMSGQRRPRLA